MKQRHKGKWKKVRLILYINIYAIDFYTDKHLKMIQSDKDTDLIWGETKGTQVLVSQLSDLNTHAALNQESYFD